MLEIIARLLEFIVIVWLVRFLLRNLFGRGVRPQASGQWRTRKPHTPSDQPSPGVISGEMKKDPQCGTYVATELSLKARYGGEMLHFCSRQCQEEFLQAHSGKPA